MSEITNTDRLDNWRNILNTMLEIEEAREVLLAWRDAYGEKMRLEDNHDWDTEMFDPITVCRRCATTYQARGNKPCKGKMAKLGLRASSADSKEATIPS